MSTLWERIKAYVSGWPIGKDEPEPKKKKSIWNTAKKPKGLNSKNKKKGKSKAKKQGNLT